MEYGKECIVNLLSALHLPSHAWFEVTEVIIVNCFHRVEFVQRSCSAQAPGDDSEDLSVDASLVSTLNSSGVSQDLAAYVAVDDLCYHLRS